MGKVALVSTDRTRKAAGEWRLAKAIGHSVAAQGVTNQLDLSIIVRKSISSVRQVSRSAWGPGAGGMMLTAIHRR